MGLDPIARRDAAARLRDDRQAWRKTERQIASQATRLMERRSKAVKRARDAGLTVTEIARELACTRATVYSWLRDE